MALGIFLIVLFIVQISSLIRLSAETDMSNKIIAYTIGLQKTMIDMETGVRGYYLTQKKSFLEPYYDGKKSFPVQLRQLHALIDSDLRYYHEIDEVESLMKNWLLLQSSWEDETTRTEKQQVADEVKSKKVMDQLREVTSGILELENRSLESNKVKRIKNANDTILYSVVLALVLGFVIALVIRQQIFRLFLSYESNYTSMMETRQELEKLNADLEKKVVERTMSLKSVNDELETFCYSVSHDLRSPLRGVDGFSQALMEDYGDRLDEEGKKYLRFIREGVQRMGQLIDDLLRLSRINRSSVQFQNFDMLALVNEVIQKIKISHSGSSIQFLVHAQEPKYVYADRGLIRIVLENLYENAVKYSSKESFPVIEFGLCPSGEGEECFYVKDNGVGFSMDHYGKLFAAFQRLHAQADYPGTGIGLATVKRIIARHGGKIWAESTPNQGAIFYFKIADLTKTADGGLYEEYGKDASLG